MQNSLPSQKQVLNWVSVFLIEKLNQADQNEDWARAAAISKIIKAVVECMEDVGSA